MAHRYLNTVASSAVPVRWSYDVFISFRGEDTRNTFTGYLYRNLRQKGINTFLDDEELKRGKPIGPALLKAIEESRIAVIIFSPDYASSSWCLDELAKIVECSESNGQILIPVYYNIERSDVHKHRGTFGEALGQHAKKFREIRESYDENMEKLQKWKVALYKASIAEEHQLKHGNESEFVQRVCKDISGRLGRLFLHVARYPVGIDTRLNELNAFLSIGSPDIRMIGIWGTGGIGKTTLAKATFNLYAEGFEGACFLGNVREASQQYRGLIHLQQLLASKILGYSEVQVDDVNSGKYLIMKRLQNKKVLIVLDDVDHLDQLDALAGSDNWFGSGSRIIITTRDEHLLVVRVVKWRYKLKELQHGEAVELLSWNAFGTPCPPENYRKFFNPLIYYAMGLPLALTTLGSYLRHQSVAQFEATIDKLMVSPKPEIYDVLKVSYDGLGDHEKTVFLDIACFFQENDKDYVTEVLCSCHLYPDIGIGVLVERSLITVESKKLQMHNLVQQMGWEIVRQESSNPGKRSRLWLHEDVLQVLEENTGTSAIKGIMVDLPKIKEICLNANAFKAMKRLQLLIVRNANFSCGPNHLPNELRWLEWSGYPSSSLPFDFCPKRLAGLKLTFGRIIRLWDGFKSCSSLANLELSQCKSLLEVPDVSSLPCLQKLTVFDCSSLFKLHESVGFLEKLVSLNIQYCSSLCILPSKLRMTSLTEVFLVGCKSVKKFPDILGMMENVRSLQFHSSGIEELPPSIENLTGLKQLSFSECNNLQALPGSIYSLRNLDKLSLSGCKLFRGFPENIENQRQLLHRPSGVGALVIPSSLISYCCFPEAPNSFSKMEILNLSRTDIVTLPHGISGFFHLRKLDLFQCKQLKKILELPPYLAILSGEFCSSLEMVQTSNLHLANNTNISFFGCPRLRKDDLVTKLLYQVNLVEIDFPYGERHTELSTSNVVSFLFSLLQPGNDVPNLFVYQIMGWNRMHFKVQSHIFGKLDGVAVCTVFCLDNYRSFSSMSYSICINGKKLESVGMPFGIVDEDHMCADHVWFGYFRLPKHFIEEHVRDGWNSVEVSFPFAIRGHYKIKKCGAHFVGNGYEMNGSPGIEFYNPDYVSNKSLRPTYTNPKKGSLVGLGPKLRISQIKIRKRRSSLISHARHLQSREVRTKTKRVYLC